MDLGLQEKVAIVTGGSDGLGRATVERFAREGVRVAVCARRREHLDQIVASLQQQTGGELLPISMDVTDAPDCERAVQETVERFGRVDILVNNAGASAAGGFESVTDEDWLADIELKVMGAVRMCRHSIPVMRANGGGSIVNATIGGAKAPAAEALPTTVTRAAGINLTKSLANEYAADNIRVNTICIGLIKSAQWERRAQGGSMDQFYADMAKRIPLGRVGEAAEYADLVAYLCSKSGSYITGTSINLDGGLCAVD
ncbi:short-chain dehydrogenase [Chromatiales bacterium (ex Bugula neritina AB1)]|nr:short-chain dehydrogenase [Chromatiales bacterium (ex Bugula neritina AB1)]